MSAWVLPDHIADVLPSEARHIEELRRILLDQARCYGYELVIPPLLEHLDSLLTAGGQAMNLQTFKLVDQLSGRTLGLRADTTPQVARIDAHLLNRPGVTRLCYCGPVLHTRPDKPYATREPLQMGAEIFGHAGPEADLEVLELALACARQVGISKPLLDLGHAHIIPALLKGTEMGPSDMALIQSALLAKDRTSLKQATHKLSSKVSEALWLLPELFGSEEVLSKGARLFEQWPEAVRAVDELRWLVSHLPEMDVNFDLGDLRGYGYYSGIRFSLYANNVSDSLARGGRYDDIGAEFGRDRPAVGFSLDLKQWASLLPRPQLRAAIRAPWSGDAALRQNIAQLRANGETVVCVMPGHESEADEFNCDRQLVLQHSAWIVQPL